MLPVNSYLIFTRNCLNFKHTRTRMLTFFGENVIARCIISLRRNYGVEYGRTAILYFIFYLKLCMVHLRNSVVVSSEINLVLLPIIIHFFFFNVFNNCFILKKGSFSYPSITIIRCAPSDYY